MGEFALGFNHALAILNHILAICNHILENFNHISTICNHILTIINHITKFPTLPCDFPPCGLTGQRLHAVLDGEHHNEGLKALGEGAPLL